MTKKIILVPILFLIPFSLLAENIILKSGKQIEGKIIERTDEYIKIDFQDISLTYYIKDVESIDGERIIIQDRTNIESTTKAVKEDLLSRVETIRESIVFIFAEGKDGKPYGATGVVIDNKGLILTVSHILSEKDQIRVRLFNGREYFLDKVVAFDPQSDFCIFKIQAEDLPALPLGDSSKLEIGDEVFYIHLYTSNILEELSAAKIPPYNVVSGIISQLIDFPNYQYVKMNIPIVIGDSGSPILNKNGEVVGMQVICAGGVNKAYALAINNIKSNQDRNITLNFAEVSKNSKINSHFYGDRAADAKQQGDYQTAIKYYRKRLDLFPDNIMGHFDLASTYALAGDYDNAVRIYLKAIQLAPRFGDLYIQLSSVYTLKDNYQEALKYAKIAVELLPDDGDAFVALACAYTGYGNYEAANDAYLKGMDLHRKIGDYQRVKELEKFYRGSAK